MKMKTKTMLCLLLSSLAIGGAAAQETAGIDVQAERARIAAERAEAQARFDAEEIACRARFAVYDCVARSKARLREMLSGLRRQELAINSAERQRQGEERLRELEQRQPPAPAQTPVPAVPLR